MSKSESTVGYNRVAIKRSVSSFDSKLSSVSPVSIRDKFVCYFTGECEELRVARIQLTAYQKTLETEHLRLGLARSQHYEGGKRLYADFERQKFQLQKWGLSTIIPPFQIQVSCRITVDGNPSCKSLKQGVQYSHSPLRTIINVILQQ